MAIRNPTGIVADGEGHLPVKTQPENDFEGGEFTVGVSAVEITFTGSTKSILITADIENEDIIYIGKSNVTTTTNIIQKLLPHESLSVDLDDSNAALYAISDTASQKIQTMALV